VRGRALVFVCTCDRLSYIYIYSVSIHRMVPVHIWCIYSLSAFFTCESGCAGLRACLRSGLLQEWCWQCLFLCFCLRLSRVVGSLTDRRCWCWSWNLYLRFSIFVLFRVCMSFHTYTCLSIGVRRTAGARLSSCYTPVTPLQVVNVCLRVLSFIYVFVCVQFVSNSCDFSVLFTSSFHSLYFPVTWGKTLWDVSVTRYKVMGSMWGFGTWPWPHLRGSLRVPWQMAGFGEFTCNECI